MPVESSVVCPVLIGRAIPLAATRLALAHARAARGGVVLVSGEAGIGKSRLVRAMADDAREAGFLVLQGACFEADRAQPYAPVLDLVRGLAASTSLAVAAHYLEPAAVELVTQFSELRAMFPEATARRSSDPEEDRRRLFQSLTEAVQALSRVQPLLLAIEDVHWSDDATLDLVLHLARRIVHHPVAVVMTFRTDEANPRLERLLADLDRARCVSEIDLGRLSPTDVAAMLQAIFGAQVAFGSPFVDGLYQFTEGNPFFVEEVLKSFVMAGDLVHQEGTWRARPLEHVRIPRTATEAVGRRLAGLSDEARRVAEVAAVAGRRFDFALLQHVTARGEAELLSIVKELVASQLVAEESADRFAFRHALTREAIRTRLLARERVALHRAIATALVEQSERGVEDLADALAYHTFEAGDWEAARRYGRQAAEHAMTLCAPREALQHLDRAVIAAEKGADGPDAALLVARGRAHETLGAFQAAHDDFTHALDRAKATGDVRAAWPALHALGMLWAARDYERAGTFRQESLTLARAIGDPVLVAHSLNRVGNWYVNRECPHEGIPYHDEALAIFERADDRRGVGETVDLLAMAHHVAGLQGTAVHQHERCIALFGELQDRRGLVNALSVLAGCGPSYHSSAGPVVASVHSVDIVIHERPVHLSTEIGWRAGEAFSRYLVADALAWRGKYGRAFHLATDSLAIAEELGHLEWQCGARRVLGAIAVDLFADTAAVEHLVAAHTIARRLGSAIWIRWTGAPLVIALARAGEIMRAKGVLAEVARLVPASRGSDRHPGPVRRTLGERYLALAAAEVALADGRSIDVVEIIGPQDVGGTPRVGLVRGQALAALERWTDAGETLRTAREDAQRQDAGSQLWRIDAAEGALHLAMRQRLEARRCFDAARAAAAEIVSGLEDATLAGAFRAGLDRMAPPPPVRTPRQQAKAAHGGLTARERDAAALVGLGKSNRAIARALGIGERTVEGYVAGALAKLDFSSRAQLAVWAAEQALVPPRNTTGAPRR